MTAGPGKYDDACTEVRRMVGLSEIGGGGVIIIVFGGNKGDGFAVQADMETTVALPEILENVARQIRDDVTGMTQ